MDGAPPLVGGGSGVSCEVAALSCAAVGFLTTFGVGSVILAVLLRMHREMSGE